jgi:Family of unknown function (DUF6298)
MKESRHVRALAVKSAGCIDLRRLASLVLLAVLAVLLAACEPIAAGIPLLPQTAGARGADHAASPGGPLTVLSENPRYFTMVGARRAVYLTGSHTWNNFQDWGLTDPPPVFDYPGYLDFLERHGHNFIRLYVWEQAAWFPGTQEKVVIAPLPYLRPGPGKALDGGPRFDLTQFNPAYFSRLRERVQAAGARGIYVSVMLFDGWSLELKGRTVGNPWRGHPFNRSNNINGIDGDTDGDGEGKEVHTLINPAVTALQKAYIRHVIDTIGDLNNVLWEISNESHPGATAWEYEMIRAVKELEATRHRPHPVGMTSMWAEPATKNASLLESPADWVSPHTNELDSYADDPPAASGKKVVISDTDHIWGIGGSPRWVWMSLLRGLNPIFMDPYVTSIRRNLPAWTSEATQTSFAPSLAPEWEDVRNAMGYARALADRIDLTSMVPMGQLASTGFCLAAPGKEYLVYLPPKQGRLRQLARSILRGWASERVEVELSDVPSTLDVEWVDAERGVIMAGDPVMGGRKTEFRAPFAGQALLHLKAR